jgi:phospholipid/cholesterol/gamma-HCH transport system ATP-binding protein
MVRFDNVTISFDGTIIIDNVSGEFKDGVVNMIIGPSGTGKTTLFKAILGLVPIDSGEIFFDKEKIVFSEEMKNSDFRSGIGMIQQQPVFSQDKNVFDSVRETLDIVTNLSSDEKEILVRHALEQVGIDESLFFEDPKNLSGGTKKKVGIARAIVHKPKYLFCDEPNSGLDPESSKVIDDLIYNISKKDNITTIVVTHNLDSIITIGEHIIFLYKSKKMWDGNKKDIFFSEVPELESFLQASEMFKEYKALYTKQLSDKKNKKKT